MMNLPIRPRRNRKSANIRGLIRETSLSPEHLIYPVFVHEGTGNQPISSLPGCTRWSVKGLVDEAKRLMDLGIRTLDLFPAIPDGKKTPDACEACNPDGLIPRTIYALKSEVPGITVMTDVALDPYNSDGHDGLVEFRSDGTMEILNDDSVEVLCRQALCHADAGADIVSPSDMMDGRHPRHPGFRGPGRRLHHGLYRQVRQRPVRAVPRRAGKRAEGGGQENVPDGPRQHPGSPEGSSAG